LIQYEVPEIAQHICVFCLKDMGCTLNSSDNMQHTILVITTGPSNGIVSFTGTILTRSVLFLLYIHGIQSVLNLSVLGAGTR